MKLTGGTLFVEHCSKFIFIHNQVFETLLHSFGLSALS